MPTRTRGRSQPSTREEEMKAIANGKSIGPRTRRPPSKSGSTPPTKSTKSKKTTAPLANSTNQKKNLKDAPSSNNNQKKHPPKKRPRVPPKPTSSTVPPSAKPSPPPFEESVVELPPPFASNRADISETLAHYGIPKVSTPSTAIHPSIFDGLPNVSTALPPTIFEETTIPSPSSLFDLATTLLPFEGMLDPNNERNDVIGDLRDSGMLDDDDDQVTLLNAGERAAQRAEMINEELIPVMNKHNSETVDTLKTSIDLPLMFKVLPSREGVPTNTLPLQYSVAASGTVNTPQILANLVAHVPNELSMARMLVSAEENRTVYGSEAATTLLRKLSPLSSDRHQMKAGLVSRFFIALSLHEVYLPLCRIIQDPQYHNLGHHPIQVFFVAFRHNSSQVNKRLFSHLLLLFSQALHKVEYYGKDLSDEVTFCMAQYESTSASMFVRSFLGICKEHGIPFNMASFKFEGSFLCYWSHTFDRCVLVRPTYGTLANASTFDPLADEKIDLAIADGRIKPFESYQDHTDLLQIKMQQHLGLRGGEEIVKMTISDWFQSTMKEGEFKGVKTWECKSSNNGQKGQRLTVINNTRTTSNRDSKYPEVLENRDPLSLYQLINRHFFQHMPPNCMPAGRIFRRAATTKQKKVWKRNDPNCTWKADPTEGGVYGKNYPNKRCKILATTCGFDNPDRCTSHGWRKKATTKMINEGQKQGLGPKSIISFTRHKNYATAAAYERPCADTRDTVIKLAQNVDDIVRPVTMPTATATIPRQQHGRQQDIYRPRGSRVSFGSSFDNQEYLNQSFDTSSSNRRPSAMQRTGTRSMSPPPVRHGLQRQRSLSADDIGSWEGDINDSPSSSAGVPLHQPLTQFTPPDPAPRRVDGGRPPVEGLSFRNDSQGVLPSPPPSADRSQLSTYDYGSGQASPQASHYDGSRQVSSPQASHYDGSHHRSRQLASPQASHYDGSHHGSHHRHGSHYRQDSPPAAQHGQPRARRISTNSFDPRQQRPSPPPRSRRRPPPLPPQSFQHTPANGYARRSYDFNRSSGRPHDHHGVTSRPPPPPPQQQYHHHEAHDRRQQQMEPYDGDVASNRPQQPSNYYSSTASVSSSSSRFNQGSHQAYRQDSPQQYDNDYHTSTSNRRRSSGDSYSRRHSYDGRNGGY